MPSHDSNTIVIIVVFEDIHWCNFIKKEYYVVRLENLLVTNLETFISLT